jgi:peptidylprolyl isomerase
MILKPTKRRSIAAVTATLLLAGLLSAHGAPAGAAPAADAEIIARAPGIEVSAQQIRTYVAALDPRTQAELAANPALLGQAVRMFIAQQLLLKQALAEKWDQQPAVAAQLDRLRQNAIGELYLQSVSQPADDFPTEAEIQSAYDGNKTAFLVPRQFRLAQIFIAAPKDADKATEAKARVKLEEVEKKLKQRGSDFAAIAQASSDDRESVARNGEIGWVPEPQIRPEIRTVALGLGNGTVGEPLRLDDGWHIIKLLDTRSAYTRPLSEVHGQIVQQLRANRASQNSKAYLGKLLAQNPPAVDEIALSGLLGKPSTAPAGH